MKNLSTLTYNFSGEDIRNLNLGSFPLLFNEQALREPATAMALLNAVDINLQLDQPHKKAWCDRPPVRAFCQKLVRECPILPWICSLDTSAYREIIYSTLPTLRVIYDDRRPGKYTVNYPVEDTKVSVYAKATILRVLGKRVACAENVVSQRIDALEKYFLR